MPGVDVGDPAPGVPGRDQQPDHHTSHTDIRTSRQEEYHTNLTSFPICEMRVGSSLVAQLAEVAATRSGSTLGILSNIVK